MPFRIRSMRNRRGRREDECTRRLDTGTAAPHARAAATRQVVRVLSVCAVFLVSGCSDGGGSGGGAGGTSLTSLEQSSRLLAQATLGVDRAEIERVEALGFEVWLAEQLALPGSSHLDETNRLIAAYGDPTEPATRESPVFRQLAWWNRVMSSPDLLRQRVALALSEIFVVSERMDVLFISPGCVASYYDTLVDHAFGPFEDLLLAVTLHPAMGHYLSHLNNDRSDALVGRFPDENYAREVMQLFSIGLFELAPNGAVSTDSAGRPIPTYGNAEITEFAKIFTGLGVAGSIGGFGDPFGNCEAPMVMYESHHEPGPKSLLRGFVIPDGQTGMQDIRDAIGHLADHPNVGPFIGRRLIQRLVTSNPSPAYLERVARVFADDGTGTRGNLGAVVRAILLDPEAREDPGDVRGGRLREPFLRFVALMRAFRASSSSGEFLINGAAIGFLVDQTPLASPSVFNFFQPDFAPNGPVADAGLVAPEFQITTDASVTWMANIITALSLEEASVTFDTAFFRPGSLDQADAQIRLDLGEELAHAGDIDALLDHLDLKLTYGTLSSRTRDAIRTFLATPGLDDPNLRSRLAMHLILMSPDYAVAR